jgi:hypothetical protein
MMGVSVLMIVVMKEQVNVPTLKYTVMIMMLVLTMYVTPKLVVNTPKSLVMIMMLVLMIHAILPLVVLIPQKNARITMVVLKMVVTLMKDVRSICMIAMIMMHALTIGVMNLHLILDVDTRVKTVTTVMLVLMILVIIPTDVNTKK